ncbi:MAG: glutamine-hydrolyzing GMP synthase [Saccharofermentanales bacterium]|jgi:GMP synthase (glutamine-hydrolysing)|nr:glutamine-hydrolyzing GMP synthase [Bacillota bacterium]
MIQDRIIILDLGSSENTDIARTLRRLGVYSEIRPHDITAAELKQIAGLKGIILNGGPNCFVEGEKISAAPEIRSLGVPVLAVDYEGAAPWPAAEEDRTAMLEDFAFDQCQAKADWRVENFIAEKLQEIRAQVGDGKVLLALSGGVDSSVLTALLHKALGRNVISVHVDNGLMRQGESEQVVKIFREQLGVNLIHVDASERFLQRLAGVADPEQKRKIIGNEFIRVFEEEARKLEGIGFLAQGTIYPDIVESGTKTVKAVKSHHNVGGLPADMKLELVEPLNMLFKDEVRAVGLALGLPEDLVYRQPFPGPGLGVRCLGAITKERLEALRASDAILREEFALAGLDKKVWQYFTVVPEFRSVGVKDGQRSYEYPCIIRAVNTVDAMTATIEEIPYSLLHRLTHRITHEVPHINRVLYDLSPKPTGTIEWE